MNIALFGASGAIGLLLTKELLEHDDTVYAYVRNPEKIKMKNNLHIIKGELMVLGNEDFKQSVSRENVARSFYEVAVQNKYIHKMPIVFNL